MSKEESPDHRPVQDTGRRSSAIVVAACAILALAGLAGIVAGAVMPAGVECWGSIQAQQNMPAEPDFVAIAGGGVHCVGLTSNGTIVSWGDNASGQLTGAPPGTGYRAVSAGAVFCMALTPDGSIVQWGNNAQNAFSGKPADAGCTAISAGAFHALALREDGSIAEWGDPDMPHAPPGETGYTAIAAGGMHNLALAANGTIVQWGPGTYDPVPPGDGYTAVAAGYADGIALAANGSIVTWGFTIDPPPGTGYQAIAAGDYSGIAIRPGTATGLAAVPNPSVYGNPVTLTATVNSSEPGIVPDGVVTFRDGVEPIGTAVPGETGQAVLTSSALAAGSHSLTASFSGNQTFAGSTSGAVVLVVNQSPAEVAVTGPSALPEGRPAGITARVSPIPPGTGVPGGTVQFLSDSAPLGDPVNCTGGVAYYNGTFAPGTYAIGAAYQGDPNFTPCLAATPLVVTVSHTPAIARFSPASGNRGTRTKVTVTGSFFQANATVNLTKGAAVIHARTKSVAVPGKIVATVKIPAKAKTGSYRLSVTSPDGGKAVAAKKFFVA